MWLRGRGLVYLDKVQMTIHQKDWFHTPVKTTPSSLVLKTSCVKSRELPSWVTTAVPNTISFIYPSFGGVSSPCLEGFVCLSDSHTRRTPPEELGFPFFLSPGSDLFRSRDIRFLHNPFTVPFPLGTLPFRRLITLFLFHYDLFNRVLR